MKVGVIGSGIVGQVLSDGFLKHGHEVMRGSRDPAKLAQWKAGAGAKAKMGTFAETARFGELVVLAVKGAAAVEAVDACEGGLAGKPVVDTTNPIAEAPPVNGVLQIFTGPNESLMERLQAQAPAARFVKAFSCVGNALMVDPELPGGKPTMFICGNDEAGEACGGRGARRVRLGDGGHGQRRRPRARSSRSASSGASPGSCGTRGRTRSSS